MDNIVRDTIAVFCHKGDVRKTIREKRKGTVLKTVPFDFDDQNLLFCSGNFKAQTAQFLLQIDQTLLTNTVEIKQTIIAFFD